MRQFLDAFNCMRYEARPNCEFVSRRMKPRQQIGIRNMSRVCELTGKNCVTGNNVSHAHNKTKRRFLPNLNQVSLMSDTLGRTFRLKVSAAALRSVDHRGGLDLFLAKSKDSALSPRALKIKREVMLSREKAARET